MSRNQQSPTVIAGRRVFLDTLPDLSPRASGALDRGGAMERNPHVVEDPEVARVIDDFVSDYESCSSSEGSTDFIPEEALEALETPRGDRPTAAGLPVSPTKPQRCTVPPIAADSIEAKAHLLVCSRAYADCSALTFDQFRDAYMFSAPDGAPTSCPTPGPAAGESKSADPSPRSIVALDAGASGGSRRMFPRVGSSRMLLAGEEDGGRRRIPSLPAAESGAPLPAAARSQPPRHGETMRYSASCPVHDPLRFLARHDATTRRSSSSVEQQRAAAGLARRAEAAWPAVPRPRAAGGEPPHHPRRGDSLDLSSSFMTIPLDDEDDAESVLSRSIDLRDLRAGGHGGLGSSVPSLSPGSAPSALVSGSKRPRKQTRHPF